MTEQRQTTAREECESREAKRMSVRFTGRTEKHRHMTVGDLVRVLLEFDQDDRLGVAPFGRKVDYVRAVHFTNLYGHAGPRTLVDMSLID